MSGIKRWLDDLGLGQYAPVFDDNQIGLDVVSRLTENDLKDLGLPIGDRRRLQAAIEALSTSDTVTNSNARPAKEPEHQPTDAERRQLTVMFCDMVGSTALSTRMDPEDYREVIRNYQDACAGVITRFDGYVARFMGDGVLAYFGWPRAHEDDVARAISAGLGLVDAVAGLAAPNGEDEPIAVRIGIATGPVVIGDIVGEGGSQEAAATGETLNLAARLEAIAATNTVVISDETHALASGVFDYENLGPQNLKGIEDAPEVWRVIGERQVESRFAAAHGQQLTPLIGRDEELDLLSRRWQHTKEGEGQVVLLAGEPGIGKSRLTRALQDAISNDPHTRVLLQCSSHYTSSALYPVISQLEFAARFATGDDAATRLDKLQTMLSQAGEPKDETVALMAALLSIQTDERYPLPQLTPQQQKDRTLVALNDHLAELTTEKPVLFVLEDAHWIDPTTLELMELTIERIRELPVLIVITYRPEFVAPWIGEDHVTLLALNRLARKERARMAAALIGETALSPEAFAQIAERSDGIPLFIEELTRSVREAAVSSGVEGTQGSATGINIPATLQDALEARFDRSPAVREVAQVGAAIGREFRYGLLEQVAMLSHAELEVALDDLASSGLIFARGTPPDASYTFKHALIQDTAYDSMVRSKRQDTHNRITKSLLSLQPDITETEPETLAHHYTEAGLLEDGIDWWTRAGQLASARSANPEALALLERGLDLITNLPESETRHRRELALQTTLFGPLINVVGQTSEELENAFNRTLELCEAVDAPEAMFRGLFAKSLALGNRGQHMISNEAANELVRRSESASDEGALMQGHRLAAMSSFLLGHITEAQKHADIVISQFDRARHGHVMITYGQDPKAIAEAYVSVYQWVSGWPEKACRAWERAIEEALALDHVGTLGPVLAWGGVHGHALKRDKEGMRQIHEHLRVLTSHHKMPIWEINERLAKAMLSSMDSPSAQSVAELLDVLTDFEAFTVYPSMLFPLEWGWYLAENYCAIGAPDLALEANEKGLKFAEASEEHWSDSELFRVRGVALAMRDGIDGNDEGESWLRRAIEDARSRHAKSFELRAATSLARFLRDQGRTKEARDELSPTYDWFTEGFDTPDLIDAKALLDELA